MKRCFVVFLLGLVLVSGSARAEDDIGPLDADWLIGFPANAGRFISQPLGWGRAEWARAGLVGAGLAGMVLLDEPIRETAQDVRGGTTDALADAVRPFGAAGLAAAAALGTWALGEAADAPRLQRVGLNAFQAVVIAQGFTQGLKPLVGRERPEAGGDPVDFDRLSGDDADRALPSGHAATAFAVATVVAEEYREIGWLPWVAYGLAAGTALSRINDDEHWATDVTVGALLGYGVGKVVSAYSPFREADRISVAPILGPQVVGLRLGVKF